MAEYRRKFRGDPRAGPLGRVCGRKLQNKANFARGPNSAVVAARRAEDRGHAGRGGEEDGSKKRTHLRPGEFHAATADFSRCLRNCKTKPISPWGEFRRGGHVGRKTAAPRAAAAKRRIEKTNPSEAGRIPRGDGGFLSLLVKLQNKANFAAGEFRRGGVTSGTGPRYRGPGRREDGSKKRTQFRQRGIRPGRRVGNSPSRRQKVAPCFYKTRPISAGAPDRTNPRTPRRFSRGMNNIAGQSPTWRLNA